MFCRLLAGFVLAVCGDVLPMIVDSMSDLLNSPQALRNSQGTPITLLVWISHVVAEDAKSSGNLPRNGGIFCKFRYMALCWRSVINVRNAG